MKLYYRISDNSYEKQKLIGATKESCLANFMKVFHGIPTTIIADKCNEKTNSMLLKTGIPIISTDYGTKTIPDKIDLIWECWFFKTRN